MRAHTHTHTLRGVSETIHTVSLSLYTRLTEEARSGCTSSGRAVTPRLTHYGGKWSPFPSNWETHSNWVLQSLSLNLLKLYLVLENWVLAADGQIRKTKANAQRDTETRRLPHSPPGVPVPACPSLLSPLSQVFPTGGRCLADTAGLLRQASSPCELPS